MSNALVPAPRAKPWLLILIAGAILLPAVFLVCWNNGLRARFIPRNFGVVEPGKLYRSGQLTAPLVEQTLKEHGIRRIICLTRDGPHPADIDAEVAAAKSLGIDRTVYPLSGNGTGAVDIYTDAIAAVAQAQNANQPTLVHCVAGAQRTGGVLALYMMLVERRPPAEAYAEMRRYGWDPADNPNLPKFLNDHMAEIAAGLVARGVIDQVPAVLPELPSAG